MIKKLLKKFMEENPYWGVFDWHPLNLALKRPKRKPGSKKTQDKP